MALRVVDTSESAKKTFKTFHARESRREIELPFVWPARLQEVGAGKAEMYRSNKWKKDLKEHEDYKHVVESTRTVYVAPGFLVDDRDPRKKIRVVGPMVEFEDPMPKHITVLGPLLGIQLCLYEGEGEDVSLPKGDEGLFEVSVARAMLAAAVHPKTKETFLLVYTEDGVHMILAGDRLSIEKDGITG
jgi:hypothetical protein